MTLKFKTIFFLFLFLIFTIFHKFQRDPISEDGVNFAFLIIMYGNKKEEILNMFNVLCWTDINKKNFNFSSNNSKSIGSAFKNLSYIVSYNIFIGSQHFSQGIATQMASHTSINNLYLVCINNIMFLHSIMNSNSLINF